LRRSALTNPPFAVYHTRSKSYSNLRIQTTPLTRASARWTTKPRACPRPNHGMRPLSTVKRDCDDTSKRCLQQRVSDHPRHCHPRHCSEATAHGMGTAVQFSRSRPGMPMQEIITTRHLAQLTAYQRPSVKFRLASFLHHTKDACKPKSCQTGLTNRKYSPQDSRTPPSATISTQPRARDRWKTLRQHAIVDSQTFVSDSLTLRTACNQKPTIYSSRRLTVFFFRFGASSHPCTRRFPWQSPIRLPDSSPPSHRTADPPCTARP